ncbi:oligoendopeptidase F [Longirhabdus pacifica]|uniref:oligoendopeptidase F n=1 Tax=Longirhabdus pacifica TaxID=2305227 RepID=UPI0010088675|nr:oligoendopeptidase F [Longirhabdus pacifica]
MSQLPKRSEIAKEHQWKIEDIYQTQQQWEDEYKQINALADKMSKMAGTLNSAKQISDCFTLEDETSQLIERLYVYAKMKLDEDMKNTEFQALTDKAEKLAVQVSEKTSFITPEILSLPTETLKSFIDDPSLDKSYKKTLEEMLRQKDHVLSEKEEALLAKVGNIAGASGNTYRMLNNADLKFPVVENEKGEEIELTHGRYIEFLESKDREVRKNAFDAMYDTYAKYKNTFASTLSSTVTKNIFYSKTRNYPSTLEMSLFGDNISKEVYTNLIDTIHEHLPLMYRYLELRRKMLNVDELHMYDLFAPIVDESNEVITYEQAKDIVLESLEPLGERYVEVVKDSYNSGWIDVYESEGKRSGAYSWGPYGTHPYILLNHKDNLNSMFTLTHEMGHAMHSYLSDSNLPYREAQYTIFNAEVASTLNEALLMQHLLDNTTDKNKKLILLAYFADQFRTTVFRQTMFAEFEKIIHEKVEQGEALTSESISKIYYDLNKVYFGEDIVVDQKIEMEWARVPHFYNSFYVYQYATGFSAANSFAKQIKDEGKPAVERYLQFLKSGGSDYSINILQKAGVDMTTPKPISEAMSVFEDIINQMEKLLEN